MGKSSDEESFDYAIRALQTARAAIKHELSKKRKKSIKYMYIRTKLAWHSFCLFCAIKEIRKLKGRWFK